MKGFTLLEVVLVCALLGILAVFAIPRLNPSPAGLDAAARKIRSDIMYVQSLAMNRGTIHGADFVAGGAYLLYQGSPATPVTDPLTRQPFSENLTRFRSTNVNNNFRVEFDSLGQPILGGGGSVVVANGGQTRTIEVTTNTGKVVIR